MYVRNVSPYFWACSRVLIYWMQLRINYCYCFFSLVSFWFVVYTIYRPEYLHFSLPSVVNHCNDLNLCWMCCQKRRMSNRWWWWLWRCYWIISMTYDQFIKKMHRTAIALFSLLGPCCKLKSAFWYENDDENWLITQFVEQYVSFKCLWLIILIGENQMK